jgi:hypothetical protein
VHCPVRATSAQPLGFGARRLLEPLSSCCTRQSGAIPDSPVPSDFCSGIVAHCSFCRVDRWRRESLLHWLTGQSSGTLDSLVNYSGALSSNSREWLVWSFTALVHRTLSDAPSFSTLKVLLPFFIESLT